MLAKTGSVAAFVCAGLSLLAIMGQVVMALLDGVIGPILNGVLMLIGAAVLTAAAVTVRTGRRAALPHGIIAGAVYLLAPLVNGLLLEIPGVYGQVGFFAVIAVLAGLVGSGIVIWSAAILRRSGVGQPPQYGQPVQQYPPQQPYVQPPHPQQPYGQGPPPQQFPPRPPQPPGFEQQYPPHG